MNQVRLEGKNRKKKRAPALIGTGTIQENRAAVRNGSGKTKERVKPDRSRETPENRSTESAKLAGGRRKSSVGAMENDWRWSGKKVLREKPQVCWNLVYLCPFLVLKTHPPLISNHKTISVRLSTVNSGKLNNFRSVVTKAVAFTCMAAESSNESGVE